MHGSSPCSAVGAPSLYPKRVQLGPSHLVIPMSGGFFYLFPPLGSPRVCIFLTEARVSYFGFFMHLEDALRECCSQNEAQQ